MWEFPGGKVESDESPEQALARELKEELGIDIGPINPLIRGRHDYGDQRVLLDVWVVPAFDGVARGLEGQPMVWVWPAELEDYQFPAANKPIIEALRQKLAG